MKCDIKMKILVDTNILISAILFPGSKPSKALLKVSEEHEMVLCEQNLTEFREVVKCKVPELLSDRVTQMHNSRQIFRKLLIYNLLKLFISRTLTSRL
jgi:predicted nucleic acid-binding protein